MSFGLYASKQLNKIYIWLRTMLNKLYYTFKTILFFFYRTFWFMVQLLGKYHKELIKCAFRKSNIEEIKYDQSSSSSTITLYNNGMMITASHITTLFPLSSLTIANANITLKHRMMKTIILPIFPILLMFNFSLSVKF